MKKIYLILIVLLAGLFSSCEKGEGTLTPSGIEEGYHMPQGNNPFDATIMGYYEKYGSSSIILQIKTPTGLLQAGKMVLQAKQ